MAVKQNVKGLKYCMLLLVLLVLVFIIYSGLSASQVMRMTKAAKISRSQSCFLLLGGDQNEIQRAKEHNASLKTVMDEEIYSLAKQGGCNWIKHELDRNYHVSKKEKNFPLAFALNVFESPNQIFRFLKIIYRPHNTMHTVYTTDQTSHESFKQFMIAISTCLPNVIVPNNTVNVVWGWHTIVDAQFNCMENLLEIQHKFSWKYVLTLCGKEVPLKTNKEMVESLIKLNGTSAVRTFDNLKSEYSFWSNKFKLWKNTVVNTHEKLSPVPFGLTIVKSMAYFGLSKAFVDYILHNKEANEFRKFMDNTFIPDEHFVATLFNRKGVPGGKNENYTKLIPLVSDYLWLTNNRRWQDSCSGWNIHDICKW